jgi:hypothetical protein
MKNGSKRWNFGFWGAESRKKSLLREAWSLNFFWFSGEVSEQSDQVARKPDFWLRTGNNDSKTEGWELGRLILYLKWLSMLQTCLEFVLIQFGLYILRMNVEVTRGIKNLTLYIYYWLIDWCVVCWDKKYWVHKIKSLLRYLC